MASLERDELLALYGCCDVFLSLHRSEGFGRGMAEALQLGVDVIATAYGRHTDFYTGPLVHPVGCQEVPIPRGSYPCADGHVWGEPDLDHAAEQMQQVAARRLALANDHEAAAADPSRDPSVLAAYRQRFSWAAAGARYRARLEELWAQRQELEGAVEAEGRHAGLRGVGRCPPGMGWWRMGLGRNRRQPRGITDAPAISTDAPLTWWRGERCQEVGLENGSLVLWPVPERAGPDHTAVAGGRCCKGLCSALAWAGFSWRCALPV